jgi:hypothetical protein
MKNVELKPIVAEPGGDHLCISLREIPQKEKGFFTKNLCFLTQDVHWVKKSSGKGVCRNDQ